MRETSTSLRRNLIEGRQWVVTSRVSANRCPEMRTFASFEGATAFAKDKQVAASLVRVDTIKCMLKIMNKKSSCPLALDEFNGFRQALTRYPYLMVPSRIECSQAFLLSDYFPVLCRQMVSFLDLQTYVWLVKLNEGERLDGRIIQRQGIRCSSLIDGLRRLEAIASGSSERRKGKTTLLVGERCAEDGAVGCRSGERTIFYRIGAKGAVATGVRLPIDQLVDPTRSYLEERLLFCKYERETGELTFFNGQLKRTGFTGGMKSDSLDFWCPRPIYFKSK
jgi:hypothetical protein